MEREDINKMSLNSGPISNEPCKKKKIKQYFGVKWEIVADG